MQIDELLGRLDKVKPHGVNQWMARCPCHDDKSPSLSVKVDGTKILLHCFAKCTPQAICAALGIQMKDLTNDTMEDRRKKFIEWYAGKNSLIYEKAYSYCYGHFNDGLTKVRFRDSSGKKTFRWIQNDKSGKSPSGFIMSHKDCPNRLYVAGDMENEIIFVVEGEKDCDNLYPISNVITVVSAEHGAGEDWKQEYTEQLAGKTVYILFDNDEVGRKFAWKEANAIATKAAAVYVLDITKAWPECPEKGDVSDMIAALGGEETWNRINDLIDISEKWDPKPQPQQQPQEAPQQAEESSTQGNTSTEAQAPQSAPQPRRTSIQLFDDFMGRIQSEAFKPIQTGMPSFDRLLGGGIPRQSLVVLSAAPGTGKTSLAQQIFETMAANGNDVIFLNLEMAREQLIARSLARIIERHGGKMSQSDVMRGYAWTDRQREFVQIAAQEYRSRIAPRMQYNPEGCTTNISNILDTLDAAGAEAQKNGKPGPVCILDYLHLVTSDQREDQSELLKRAVAGLKRYAIQYNTFVFAISANNRTSNSSGIVSLESGRDSSTIEYTADIQLSLNYRALHEKLDITYRTADGRMVTEKAQANNPDHMEALQKESPRRMLVQVLKNRMSEPGGKLYLNFDAAQSKFTPVDTQRMEPRNPAGWRVISDEENLPF